MSFFNLQEINHHHHHHHRNRVDEHDHSVGNTSSSRSYDCVFCQRGFTTAQALGGHMNIHRKDRANPTTTTNKNPTYKETNNILSNKEMVLEEDNYQLEATSNNNNTGLFYSKGYLSSQNRHHNNGGSSHFEGQALHAFLGSEKSTSRGSSRHHMLGKMIQDNDHSKDREELDLELRLGHYSW